eukprot:1154308-Pelagomonas_calceolata.AAC.3
MVPKGVAVKYTMAHLPGGRYTMDRAHVGRACACMFVVPNCVGYTKAHLPSSGYIMDRAQVGCMKAHLPSSGYIMDGAQVGVNHVHVCTWYHCETRMHMVFLVRTWCYSKVHVDGAGLAICTCCCSKRALSVQAASPILASARLASTLPISWCVRCEC